LGFEQDRQAVWRFSRFASRVVEEHESEQPFDRAALVAVGKLAGSFAGDRFELRREDFSRRRRSSALWRAAEISQAHSRPPGSRQTRSGPA
jgi:hypothetical protein